MRKMNILSAILLTAATIQRIVVASISTTTRPYSPSVVNTTTLTAITEHCDDGWVYHSRWCYLIRDEYESFVHADATCAVFGAELAYGRDKLEVDYLADLISNTTYFGFWYGMKVEYEGNAFFKDPETNRWVESEDNTVPLPDFKLFEAPQYGCAGIQKDSRVYPLRYLMMTVPCGVRLPYICRGDFKSIPILLKTDTSHFLNTSANDTLWFSSPFDTLTYDEAAEACENKKMRLLFARNSDELTMIGQEIESRGLDRIDPWWIGLNIKGGIYTWSNGAVIDTSILIWKRTSSYTEGRRILLADGSLLDKDVYTPKAPFICMQPHRMYGQFGCPHRWIRAGQSCYSKPHTDLDMYQEDAARLCAKMNSHLISVDTHLEKQWFAHSTLADDNKDVWTSLNDKKTHGEFVWADGSAYTPGVVTWQSIIAGTGGCFEYSSISNDISRADCSSHNYVGCQYPASSCASSNWLYNKRHCYYFHLVYINPHSTGRRFKRPFNTMLHFCYDDVRSHGIANMTEMSPLKLDSQAVLDIYSPIRTSFWIGLKEESFGLYTWADGSLANLSLFSNSNGGYRIPGFENQNLSCALMDKHGEFRKEPCQGCRCARMLCEKEVPYPPVTDSNSIGSHAMISYHLLMIVVFAFFRHCL